MEDCKLKVLYVTQYAGYLGANRSLLQILKGLKKYNVVPVVIIPEQGEIENYLKEENIQYYIIRNYCSLYLYSTVKYKNIYHVAKGSLYEVFNVFIALYYSIFCLRKCNFNLVHSNTSATNFGAYLAFFLGIKHVWHVREFLKLHYKLTFPWGYKIQRFFMRNMADILVPISQVVMNYLKQFVDDTKLYLIYNGVEIPPLNYNEKSFDLINIATVGLIHPSKRQLLVIRAIAILIDKGFDNIHLTVIGNCDPSHREYMKKIEDFIAEKHLENYITFTGYVKDVNPLLSKMHIGVLASENEAFGRVTIEYMLNRLVPIVAKSGGNLEIINDGVNGFVFDNIDDLVNILSKILGNISVFRDITIRAFQDAAEKYSVDANVISIYNCYNKVINR